MASRMVACSMTSSVRSCYSELIGQFHNRRNCLVIWKNSKYNRKKLQFVTVYQFLLSSTFRFW